MTSRFECPRCQTVFTRDKGEDEAYVECPSCGAMAMSVGEATDALARHFSAGHDIGPSQPEQTTESLLDDDDDSGMVHRPEPSLVNDFGGVGGGGAGIFAGLLTVPDRTDAVPPPVAGGLDLGLDEELGDFHLPAATTPGNPALSPQKKTVGAKKTSPPPPPTSKMPADLPSSDVNISLGDDALDALGAAFDSMAARPSQQRGADGLSDDERSFLNADMPKRAPEPPPPPRRPPPRPPGKPGERRQPPPPRAKKRAPGDRPTSTGIALSAEAKEAAFLPLKPVSSPPASAHAPETAIRPRAKRAAVGNEATAVVSTPVAEPTTVIARPTKVAPREKPTVLAGVSKLAMAAAVVFGLLGGGVVGAATAPSPVKRNDARGRAEQQLAEGNRYYQVGRFNDAIAAYKAALSLDRAYAVAHRAKGAALANAQRYDEAAEAYRDYLALEPQAIDAADIKEALTRRGVAPVVAGGADGR